ncbi:hypothetical protein BGX23_000410, partial [Mortierella sp. AD031]
ADLEILYIKATGTIQLTRREHERDIPFKVNSLSGILVLKDRGIGHRLSKLSELNRL